MAKPLPTRESLRSGRGSLHSLTANDGTGTGPHRTQAANHLAELEPWNGDANPAQNLALLTEEEPSPASGPRAEELSQLRLENTELRANVAELKQFLEENVGTAQQEWQERQKEYEA